VDINLSNAEPVLIGHIFTCMTLDLPVEFTTKTLGDTIIDESVGERLKVIMQEFIEARPSGLDSKMEGVVAATQELVIEVIDAAVERKVNMRSFHLKLLEVGNAVGALKGLKSFLKKFEEKE